ncbi:MAG: archaetidylserine decarboxylase [Chlamydiales bacterium]|nr:archaetidylserine decarboxylase [Chlamydiales bacterium]
MSAEGITYIERRTGQHSQEEVMASGALNFFYGNGLVSRIIGTPVRHLICRCALFSRIVGWYQEQTFTKHHIEPFVKRFDVDVSEFEKTVEQFTSFSDFFIRKLKPSVRPIARGEGVAVIPADGRYYFFQDVSQVGAFDIKGQTFDLTKLLESPELAQRYAKGSMVLARLCPSDYHRFHFPVTCTPSESRLINGCLYSVNPIAIKQSIRIFWQNKRSLSTLQSTVFGDVLVLEVGATTVGNIVQTYEAGKRQQKGEEKGYFNFGGSALVLLFPEGSIEFDEDLIAATKQRMEIRCLMGQSMGRLVSNGHES